MKTTKKYNLSTSSLGTISLGALGIISSLLFSSLSSFSSFSSLSAATLKVAIPSYNPETSIVLERLAAKFTLEHPEIKIEVQTGNSKIWKQEVSDIFTSNPSLDGVFAPHNALSAYVAASQIAPLEDSLSPEQLAIFPEALLSTLRLNGHLYALPSIAHVPTLYVNTDLLSRVGAKFPRTWDDVSNIAQLLTERTDAYGYGIPGKGPDIERPFLYLVSDKEGSLLRQTTQTAQTVGRTKSILNSSSSIHAAKWLYDMIDKGYTQPNVVAYDRDALVTLFSRNKLGLLLSDDVSAQPLHRTPSPVKFTQVRIPSSIKTQPNNNSRTTLGFIDAVYIAKRSAHREETLKFLLYVLTSEPWAMWMAKTGLLPSTLPPYEKSFQNQPSLQTSLALLPQAQFQPPLTKSHHKIITSLRTGLLSLYNHQISPEAGMETIHQQVTKLLK